jgi:transposase InsO family protein
VPTLDCGDRTAVVVVTQDPHGPAVLASVERKLRESFGEPANVPGGVEFRTDHGPQSTGADGDHRCERWRLDHTFAPVGRPTGNAVAECFIRTMKEELAWRKDPGVCRPAARRRGAVARRPSSSPPHQALGSMPPAEYRALRLAAPLTHAA